MKVLSLFSGIGAFEKALDNLKIPYELVGYCEIDKHASKSYAAIHGVDESMNLGDITKIDTSQLPKDIDLLTYGFPCQDISLCGKMRGLFNEDGTQTRSGLFFEALRLIEDTKPRIAIAENVKNLIGKKFKEQFEIVLNSLEEAGYNNYWQVLNAKDYGIPQNRERVFIISIRKDIDTGLFKFPQGFPLNKRVKDILEDEVDEKYYITNVQMGRIVNWKAHQKPFERVLGKESISPTLTARGAGEYHSGMIIYSDENQDTTNMQLLVKEATKKGFAEATVGDSVNLAYPNSTTRRGRVGKQVAQTLTTNPQQGVVVEDEPKIIKVDIPQIVKVRKYPVDTTSLCECLRDHKIDSIYTNREISEILNVPLTKVEHWFRKDDCFAIPDADLWMQLKALLKIRTNEFDESIMTFEEKEGVYEKSERHYLADGIAPTLTSTSASAEKIIVNN